MSTVDERIEPLKSLLRGELAAVESYQQALKRFSGEPFVLDLVQIQNDHWEAVDILGQRIIERGGRPDAGAKGTGTFAHAMSVTAQLFGNTAALDALMNGERRAIEEYELALQNPNLDPECKALIRSSLLPQQRCHLPMLDRLIHSWACF